MTPREFFYLVEGAQWRYERETLVIVSALVGKSVDELMGRTTAVESEEI